MKDLKDKTIRGGVARLSSQAVNFVVRLGSLMVLARLLDPKDFGLVAMVTAFTGVLNLFRDFGLSSAAVQRGQVTDEQVSTLFWINLLVGVVLAMATIAGAPVIAAFYHEPDLVGVTASLSMAFVFNAAGVQHSVLLQRELRFTALAIVNTISLIFSSSLAIIGAAAGYGYWALVAMTLVLPLATTIGCWVATRWVPGRPHRNVGIRSLVRFGGTVTMNGLVYYVASNFDKILLGRYWGVDALGLYGRAFQLINIPTDNLNTAAGDVAFSVLSRLQNDPPLFRSYFLKGYAIVLTLTLPLSLACGLFADDVTAVFLGSKWGAAAPVFRLLAPAMMMFAIVNPLGWLLTSLGLVRRGLTMAIVLAPLMIGAYIVGLPYGPSGVATAYSAVMLVWVVPAVAWAVQGTVLSMRDVVVALSRPMGASLAGGAVAVVFRFMYGAGISPFVRLILESTILLVTFAGVLLFAMGQSSFYFDLLRRSTRQPTASSALS